MAPENFAREKDLYIIVQVIECSEAKVFGTPEVSTIVQVVMYLHSHLTFLLKLC